MPERDPLARLSSLLARGKAIDWDLEESRARNDEELAGIRHLRSVAAMTVVHRALMSGASDADLSESVSRAKNLAGSSSSGSAGHAAAEPAPPLEAGSRWGMLEVHERIGGGSFGDVYRARDTRLDRDVALKVLNRDASDPRAEVVREARLLARIRHPNVVMVHGADRIGGRVGIWTEFLRGKTLDALLREKGVLDGKEATLIGLDLCRALSAVHAAGIVHQDVKLTNVMKEEDGRIVLMDFGLGREAEQGGSRRALSGTPLFMAPEVLAGSPSDARSDLYSLGVVFFALVTGALPVAAATLEELRACHARGDRRAAKDLRADLPPALVRFLDRALSPDPEKRFQSAAEAEQSLLLNMQDPAAREALRRDATGVPRHLPEETDTFVGREDDLVALDARLRNSRFVTLLGPGGIGKTRLAAQYGRRSLGSYPGGVWFCDLTEARSRDGIASAVGASLGVPLGTGDVIEQLGHAIGSRGRSLVILDNFEQVVGEALPTLGAWLARAPEASFLVTSRERLKISGEDVQPVESLPIDGGVELFVQRARRQRSVDMSGPEAESIGDIVRLVEGIPLAIELSAARLSVMTPAQMVDRMAERFRILAGTGAGRHATLRAAIDGSWELLKPWEKAAFTQCSVFEGGFGLDAAEGVLRLEAWPDAPWVVDVLQSLVDKSLVRSWVREEKRSAARPVVRFGMLVSLQEYAREILETGEGSADGARRRHAQWFARFGSEEAIAGLDLAGGVDRRRDLEPDLDNLVTACRRMVIDGDGETAIRCFRAAWAVLELRGPLATAVDLGRRIEGLPLTRGERSELLNLLGLAEQRSGRMSEGRRLFEEALAIDRERGDRAGEGRTLARLASISLNEGRTEEANALLEQALAIHRETGDRRMEGITLGNMGLGLHEQGRLEEAGAVLEESLAIHRDIGNRRSEGIVLGNLGDLRGAQGRTGEALRHLEAALVIHREVGNRRFEGIVLGNLGTLCQKIGRMSDAGGHFQAALAIHRDVGSRRFEGQGLDNVANLFHAEGRREEARARLEEALAIHRETGNRRGEAIALGRLAALALEADLLDEARNLLSRSEPLLRAPEYRVELGKVLCTRAEFELRAGNPEAARETCAEIERIAEQVEARPDSELLRRLAAVRRTPSGPSTPSV